MWGNAFTILVYISYKDSKLSKNSYSVYTYYAMCSIRVLGQFEVYSIPFLFKVY